MYGIPQRSAARASTIPAIALAMLLLLAGSPAHGAAQLVMRAGARSLTELPGVRVVVGQLTPEASEGGLDSVGIRTTVELELRRAGVRVVRDEDVHLQPGLGTLLVNLVVMRDRTTGGYVYRAKMELRQDVRLARQADVVIPATTWAARDAIIALGGRFNLRDDVAGTHRAQVAEFLNDYFTANPVSASR
jgi:hypothetical protein